MIAIVAVDNNWAIGRDGQLLAELPRDLAHFAKVTEGAAVIMGRKTFESLPDGQPLYDRLNIVLSHDRKFAKRAKKFSEVRVVDEPNMLGTLARIRQYCIQEELNKVVVIGGQQIYEQLLPECEKLFVTKIDTEFEDADTWFPDIDAGREFVCLDRSEPITEAGYTYRFYQYLRIHLT